MSIRTVCVFWFCCALVSGCGQRQEPAPVASPVALAASKMADLAIPQMPVPVANNAVALIGDASHFKVYSFLGLLTGKSWREVTSRAFEYDSLRLDWREIDPVPGLNGRLAATAETVAGMVYVLGGYSVAEDGSEVSDPGVYRLNPQDNRYTELGPMPVPVDDTLSAVYEDRYIYLVSGWHDTDNVDIVQVYDTREESWIQATPYPGPALFGHSGGLVGNKLVVCDGVKVVPLPEPGKREFVISDLCYVGDIDPDDVSRIKWRQIDSHPGVALYRSAAAGIGDLLVFAGGSGNPYNYNGIGYDSIPSVPLTGVLAFDPLKGTWISLPSLATASMDHRGLLVLGQNALIVGGMDDKQQVTAAVQVYTGLNEQ